MNIDWKKMDGLSSRSHSRCEDEECVDAGVHE